MHYWISSCRFWLHFVLKLFIFDSNLQQRRLFLQLFLFSLINTSVVVIAKPYFKQVMIKTSQSLHLCSMFSELNQQMRVKCYLEIFCLSIRPFRSLMGKICPLKKTRVWVIFRPPEEHRRRQIYSRTHFCNQQFISIKTPDWGYHPVSVVSHSPWPHSTLSLTFFSLKT